MCARCVLDQRLLDMSFSPAFLDAIRRPEEPLSMDHLRFVEPLLYVHVVKLWELVEQRAWLAGGKNRCQEEVLFCPVIAFFL